MTPCPLCQHLKTLWVGEFQKRRYWLCGDCDLIFVDRNDLPSRAFEQSVYDLHHNQDDDPGYLRFLSRLAEPLLAQLEPHCRGLDFGCGPGPAMNRFFIQAGHQMECYDPIYAADQTLLDQTYDFVTSSEVVEHFHEPRHSWGDLLALVRPGGWIGIMTKRHLGVERFGQWHYKNDPTHVAFYSEATLHWIAQQWQLTIEFVGSDVALLRRM
jgi:SAM-dependent methyltransferase